MKQHIGIAAIILFATTVAALAMFGPDYTTPMYAATPLDRDWETILLPIIGDST